MGRLGSGASGAPELLLWTPSLAPVFPGSGLGSDGELPCQTGKLPLRQTGPAGMPLLSLAFQGPSIVLLVRMGRMNASYMLTP